MSSSWGNDRHGPGGDPSWLGGRDRDTAGGGTSGGQGTGWSSDFSADTGRSVPDSDVAADAGGGRAASSALPTHGPRFGRADRADARGGDDGWRSDFSGGSDTGPRRRSGNLGKDVFRGLTSIAIIIVVAIVIGLQNDSNMGFFLLVAILPIVTRLVRRVIREVRRG